MRSSISPFRTTANRYGNSSQSLQSIVRSLERQNSSLVQEINMYKQRCRKTNELEDKIDLVLKHNTQLLNENERLAKLINQKKTQIDLWKNKHDNLSVNRSTASQHEIKRLLNEIQKLKQEACEIEHIKNIQINEIKNQQHLDIQNLKRGNLSSAQKYELEIRKLKQYCDKKDYEISDLNMKIVRLNKQTQFEIGKLRQQKDRLRSDLAYEQSQHRKQVESLKTKFDYNFHSQMQNLKKQHINQVDTLDYENAKLKQVIDSKNRQIDQIMSKHSKVKNNYEDSIQLLKNQNNQLKDKIVQTQHIGQLQLNNLRQKLQGIKQSQIALLKDAHSNQIDLLNKQINKLQRFLDSRNQQIQIIHKQRNQIRQTLQNQIIKSKACLQAQINDNKVSQIRHMQALKVCDQDLKFKNQQIKTLQAYLKSKIDSITMQRNKINEVLQKRDDQLERQRNQHRGIQRKLQNKIQNLQQQLSNGKDEYDRINRRLNGDLQDYKKISQLKIKQLQTSIRGLEEEGKQKDNVINQLKQNIQLLKIQLKHTQDKVNLLQNNQKQLRRTAKDNLVRWDGKQKQLNRLIKQQIDNKQRTKTNQIDQLKAIHHNKLTTLKHQIKQLQRLVQHKNKNLQTLKQQYDQLVNKFQQVFGQQASKKSLDIKVPGWLPDTLATKSLFDVFLKNKVIEYCS